MTLILAVAGIPDFVQEPVAPNDTRTVGDLLLDFVSERGRRRPLMEARRVPFHQYQTWYLFRYALSMPSIPLKESKESKNLKESKESKEPTKTLLKPTILLTTLVLDQYQWRAVHPGGEVWYAIEGASPDYVRRRTIVMTEANPNADRRKKFREEDIFNHQQVSFTSRQTSSAKATSTRRPRTGFGNGYYPRSSESVDWNDQYDSYKKEKVETAKKDEKGKMKEIKETKPTTNPKTTEEDIIKQYMEADVINQQPVVFTKRKTIANRG